MTSRFKQFRVICGEDNRDGKREKKESAGTNRNEKLIGAALRLGVCISRVFVDNIKRYDQDEDIVDRSLHYEIQSVKNGENPVI